MKNVITILIWNLLFNLSIIQFPSANPENCLSPVSLFKRDYRLDLSKAYTVEDYLKNPDDFGYIDGKKFEISPEKKVEFSVIDHEDQLELIVHDINKPDFSIRATIKENNLHVTLKVRLKKNGQEIDRSIWRGCELFDLAYNFFKSQVNSIIGYWTIEHGDELEDNIMTVNRLTAQGMSLDEAIKRTWTSEKAAFKNNFRKITYDPLQVMGISGEYTRIKVNYYRSDLVIVSA